MKQISLAAIYVALLLLMQNQGHSQDWPQWRGPELNSVASSDNQIVDELSKDSLLWSLPLESAAGSSPVVAGNRIFMTSVDKDNALVVICVKADEGTIEWKKTVEGRHKPTRPRDGNTANNSPITDGKHLWTMFGNGQINCFTVAGEPVWDKNLQDSYSKFEIMFGMSTTPVLYDDQLFFALIHGKRKSSETSVGKLVSLDAKTGKERWVSSRKTDATQENKHVYASPVIDASGQQPQLIVHGADYTTGHSLKNGKELWKVGGINPKDSYNKTLRLVSSPAVANGWIIVPTAKRGPVLGLKSGQAKRDSDAADWQSPKITPDVSSPVIHNDRIFLARENGTLACLDLQTGRKLKEKRYMPDKHRSTPIAIDGKLVLVDRKGKVIMVKADESLKELSSFELKEETIASPAIANHKIFIRTYKGLHAFGNK